MITLRIVRILICACFLGALSALHAQTLVHSWDFSRGTDSPGLIDIPEATDGPSIQFRATGARLETDADEQNRRVLVFDGTQTDGARSRRDLEIFNSVQIRARFKPVGTGAPQQTILMVSGAYELRYNPARSRLEFIVRLPDKRFHAIHAEVSPGVWNEAVATFKDGRLSLTVGLARAEGVLPAGVSPDPLVTTIRLAHFADRPFTGSISRVSLSIP